MLKGRRGARACVHARVCAGEWSPGKNGEHSVSPKPQDPSRKSKVLNIWSWGFKPQDTSHRGRWPTHYWMGV